MLIFLEYYPCLIKSVAIATVSIFIIILTSLTFVVISLSFKLMSSFEIGGKGAGYNCQKNHSC